MPSKSPQETLKDFISVCFSLAVPFPISELRLQRDPGSWYTFDSERDAPQSEICREGTVKGRECIIVRLRFMRSQPILTCHTVADAL